MKKLTIYSIDEFYPANKIMFVKLLKESTNLNLKEAKDLADEIFSKFRDDPNEEWNKIICDIRTCSRTEPNVIPEKNSFVIALDTIRKGLYESHKLRQEIDQLKQINHELTKEIRSLKSTLYKTAVDLNKHYQSVANLLNYDGPRAEHIIKDLAAEIAEDEQ